MKQFTLYEITRSSIIADRERLYSQGIDPQAINSDNIRMPIVSDKDIEQMRGWLKVSTTWADTLDDESIRTRIRLFSKRLEKPIQHYEFLGELRALREAFEEAIDGRYLYLYPATKFKIIDGWKDEWRSVIEAFPDSATDIFYAIDCYCSDQNTASVFHSMRVVESGLSFLAKELEKDFSTQNWGVIIDQIEFQIKNLGKTLSAGGEKNKKLQFYSQVAREMTFFKDGWRNYVSHNRSTYTEAEAKNVIEHVKYFMLGLAKNMKA